MLHYGDVLEAFGKATTKENIPRYQIADGWISGKIRGGNEDAVLKVLREVYSSEGAGGGSAGGGGAGGGSVVGSPMQYEIIREGGAKLRAGCSLASAEKGLVPEGQKLTVAERRWTPPSLPLLSLSPPPSPLSPSPFQCFSPSSLRPPFNCYI